MSKKKLVEAISNGLGAPSIYLLYLAGTGKIPATVSITADTGSELDRVWNTGERTTALQYWEQVVKPLADQWGIDCRFVRAKTKKGVEMPSLWAHTEQMLTAGKMRGVKIPLFGSRKGRLRQACTQRWKVTAIRQELRAMGADNARNAQGIHRGEIHRMKGANRRLENGWWTYNDIDGTYKKGPNKGKPRIVKWCSHYYPLVDLGLYRQDIRDTLTRLGIPFLETSECDFCPHKDRSRWLRTSDDTLQEIATLEARFDGQFFFTSKRKPLLEVIQDMRSQSDMFADESDFGCGVNVCGV